ncbi:FecR domain-containing protein [Myxococcota bacterium]|nr:FecR domain-containing protein [Myxococcota bacterium]MBU1410747.1 FecR domain-containing protein [Myxococcota bacterium]MBU1511650.1 FecR domain-containing protein [Myxococcota bacterium]
MLRKTAFLVCSLMVLGCGGKKKDEAPAPAPAPGDMTEVAMAEQPKVEQPKVDEPKVDEPKVETPVVAEEDKLPVEAVATEVAGTVEVKPAGSDAFVALAVNAELSVGDHVRVSGDDGMLKLRMWDDSIVSLGSGAEAVINPGADVANSSPSITLLNGTSNLMVEPRGENQSVFMVYTPAAILSVLGTEFDVGVADTGTVKLGVEEGTVQVSSQEGSDLMEVAGGKAVVISLDGTTSKAAGVVAYDAEKEDWAKWYEAESKAAQEKIAVLTTATSERLEVLKKQMETLEKNIAEMEAKSAELVKKTESAASSDDLKAYDTEAAPLVEILDENTLANRENQRLMAMMTANTYMLRRLQALVAAGVIKPSEAQAKIMAVARTQTEWVDAYDENKIDRLRNRYKRDRRMREVYLRHHPRGRQYAVKAKIELPAFYGKIPVKVIKPRVVKPKFIAPVKYQPRQYRGPARKEIVIRPVTPNWHAARPYAPADPTRIERQKRIAERVRRARPKVEVKILVEQPKFRHRRPVVVVPGVPGVVVDPRMPMGHDGMDRDGMDNDGMDHDGMGHDGMGPRCKGPRDMSPECMGGRDGMHPAVIVVPPMVVPGMMPVVVPGPGPRVRGPQPVPAPEPPMARHKRDM